MVNRLLRRHGFEDYSTFTLPETLLALDLVNQAIQDLLSSHDYPWNIRHSGVQHLFGPLSGTGTASSSSGAVTITGFTNTTADITGGATAGDAIAYIKFPVATSHSNTAMRILNVSLSGTTLTAILQSNFPGGDQSSTNWRMIFPEYLLGDTVAKVLSVRHQDRPLRLLEIDPWRTFDEVLPNSYEVEGDPEVVMVGGTATATYDSVGTSTPTQGLRMAVWPVPNIQRTSPASPIQDQILNFTFKERIAELTTTTSELVAPAEFIYDVIDRAEALSNMTQRFNDPTLSQLQMRASVMNAERKYVNSTVDPNRRHSLRPHDRGTRRNVDPTVYRDIDGL